MVGFSRFISSMVSKCFLFDTYVPSTVQFSIRRIQQIIAENVNSERIQVFSNIRRLECSTALPCFQFYECKSIFELMLSTLFPLKRIYDTWIYCLIDLALSQKGLNSLMYKFDELYHFSSLSMASNWLLHKHSTESIFR